MYSLSPLLHSVLRLKKSVKGHVGQSALLHMESIALCKLWPTQGFPSGNWMEQWGKHKGGKFMLQYRAAFKLTCCFAFATACQNACGLPWILGTRWTQQLLTWSQSLFDLIIEWQWVGHTLGWNGLIENLERHQALFQKVLYFSDIVTLSATQVRVVDPFHVIFYSSIETEDIWHLNIEKIQRKREGYDSIF